jgi:hypothetical protein
MHSKGLRQNLILIRTLYAVISLKPFFACGEQGIHPFSWRILSAGQTSAMKEWKIPLCRKLDGHMTLP